MLRTVVSYLLNSISYSGHFVVDHKNAILGGSSAAKPPPFLLGVEQLGAIKGEIIGSGLR